MNNFTWRISCLHCCHPLPVLLIGNESIEPIEEFPLSQMILEEWIETPGKQKKRS